MKKMFCWVMATILVCSTSTFMSCSNDDAKLTSITLNKATLTLTVGQTETLKATTYPSDAADPSYTWSSNSTDVATVDANGKVTAVAVGTATSVLRPTMAVASRASVPLRCLNRYH